MVARDRSRYRGNWHITLYIWIYKVEEDDNSDAQIRRKILISATENNNMEIIWVTRRMCQKAQSGLSLPAWGDSGRWMMQESSQTWSYLLLLYQWIYQWPLSWKHTCFTHPDPAKLLWLHDSNKTGEDAIQIRNCSIKKNEKGLFVHCSFVRGIVCRLSHTWHPPVTLKRRFELFSFDQI